MPSTTCRTPAPRSVRRRRRSSCGSWPRGCPNPRAWPSRTTDGDVDRLRACQRAGILPSRSAAGCHGAPICCWRSRSGCWLTWRKPSPSSADAGRSRRRRRRSRSPRRRSGNRQAGTELVAQLGSIRAGRGRIPGPPRMPSKACSEHASRTDSDPAGRSGRDCKSAVYDCRVSIPLLPTTRSAHDMAPGGDARGPFADRRIHDRVGER